MKGVTSLYFVFNQKVHIKGFKFTKKAKAYQGLYAGECNQIYGDSYRVNGKAIEDIGNNVTLVFDHMDFGPNPPSGITLCWRSIIDKNSIQLLPQDEKEEQKEIIEVQHSKDYCEETFTPNLGFTGAKTLSLVFLPGTKLDLNWIKFNP